MKQRSAGVEPGLMVRALEAAGQVMFELDPSTDRLQWSDPDAAQTIFQSNQSDDTAPPRDLSAEIDVEFVADRAARIEAARAVGAAYTAEYKLSRDDGQPERWVEERGTWLQFGENRKLVGVIRVIDEQKVREDQLSYLANYDEPTGLLNRAKFRDIIEDAISGVQAGSRTGTLFLVGIDGIGQINNDFGFDIADQVIVEAASRLSIALGDKGVCGRIAGTKFSVLLHEGDHTTMANIARRVMSAMRANVVETQAGSVAFSVCIGAARLSPATVSAESAMAEADAAFDQARSKGPSSFEVFSDQTNLISRRKYNSQMTDVILTALNDRRIYLAYQPIVTDALAKHEKFECLVRMRSDEGREIPAPSFIPAAERLGLVHLLDRRVLEIATEALRNVPDINLAVNLSWETVKDPVWAEGYLAHLKANQNVTDRLTIELTETQMVTAIEESVEFVTAIKKLGCLFAIDDFGAGYTSFRNLKALDIDILKIDGSFVSGVSTSRENQLFVRTLLDLARNFGIKTVAEWVDSTHDATLLKALGVDFLQGFHIGKPTPHPEWTKSTQCAENTASIAV